MNVEPYLKAVAGFVGAVGINIAYRLVDESSALPAFTDGKGWALFLISSVAATAVVYGIPAPGYIRPKADHTAVVYQPGAVVELPPSGPLPDIVAGRQSGGRHRKPDPDEVGTETGTIGPAGEATRVPRRRLF